MIKPTEKHVLLYFYILISISLIAGGYYFYWTSWPFNVLDVVEPPTVMQTIPIHPGDQVFYSIHFRKHRAIHGTAYRDLVDTETGANISLGQVSISAGKIKEGVASASALIPIYTPPDRTYRIEWMNVYPIHKLRDVVEKFTSEPFPVVAKDGG